ncbi:type VII secretion target [Carbonactinospora thermoautotrophica]|uniref:type VII secretion target n=1 Tax=Carbonactinospora thermoautotrophica TaxID=1469144 RepID=UPI00226ED2FF|nr:type VII secretion target [Carbonactinospora thermoautotrophica]
MSAQDVERRASGPVRGVVVDILRILNPDRDPGEAVQAAQPAAGGVTAPGGDTVQVQPERLTAAGQAASGVEQELAAMARADAPGSSARAAAAGLRGWRTASALQHVAETWRSQLAALTGRIGEAGQALVEGARSYQATDENNSRLFWL